MTHQKKKRVLAKIYIRSDYQSREEQPSRYRSAFYDTSRGCRVRKLVRLQILVLYPTVRRVLTVRTSFLPHGCLA